MIDYTNLNNPYDFANPVSERDLFVGREDIMEDIKYYLDHATKAPRPINIALIGQRASGKTSILNMTEIEAHNRGFCVVRIDLDEDDSKTLINFFQKLFDGILTVACEHGAFGGKQGETYDTYLDMVNAYEVPEDKIFCPFLFPIQYAKAMQRQNYDAQLSDQNYKNDLKIISKEVNCPFIILFDEGNVFAKSRVHLEKLRNIFMNTPGFMLVLTGTSDLFPVMDEVFSPIIRQFKKINVREFQNVSESEDCINKPLEKLGLKKEDLLNKTCIKEIHDLSGGRPYEIQLICHFLFRRLQKKRAKQMKLDLNVLEDVRRELETSQDITIRPVLQKIRKLRRKQFRAINLLCACDGQASFDQIWGLEYLFYNDKRWTKESLNNELLYLKNEGILSINNNLIKFNGDDFDKIYTKYFSREQSVSLSFPQFSLDTLSFIRMNLYLTANEKRLLNLFGSPDIEIDIENVIYKLNNKTLEEDIFVEEAPYLKQVYLMMVDYRHKECIPLLDIKLMLPWAKVHSFYYSGDPNDNSPVELGLGYLNNIIDRVKDIGGSLIFNQINLRNVPIDILSRKVEATGNERIRNELAAYHVGRMVGNYCQQDGSEEAGFHANLAIKYAVDLMPSDYNNLGYYFMKNGDLGVARGLFTRGIDICQNPNPLSLIKYNLAVLEVREGKYEQALLELKESIALLNDIEDEQRICLCLIVPTIRNDQIIFEENRSSPDLKDIARSVIKWLESYHSCTAPSSCPKF